MISSEIHICIVWTCGFVREFVPRKQDSYSGEMKFQEVSASGARTNADFKRRTVATRIPSGLLAFSRFARVQPMNLSFSILRPMLIGISRKKGLAGDASHLRSAGESFELSLSPDQRCNQNVNSPIIKDHWDSSQHYWDRSRAACGLPQLENGPRGYLLTKVTNLHNTKLGLTCCA